MTDVRRGMTVAAVILALTITVSCADTKLTSVWMDRDYRGGVLRNAMVIGVTENERNRRIFEDLFVEALAASDVDAVASASVFPVDRDLDASTVKKKAESMGIDAVVVTHLAGVVEKQVYHPPTTTAISYPDHYYRYDAYYHAVNTYVTQPGYYQKYKYVRLETNLYETASEKLVWSGASETLESGGANAMIKGVVDVIVKDWRSQGLLE
jgi:hypothetical protein